MRREALRILHESISEMIPFHTFENALKRWEIIPLMNGPELVGCFAVNGNEVHIAYAKQVFIRRHIKTVFKPLIDSLGSFVTTVRESNQRGFKFCKRMGFTETRRENGIIYMQCERLNYV